MKHGIGKVSTLTELQPPSAQVQITQQIAQAHTILEHKIQLVVGAIRVEQRMLLLILIQLFPPRLLVILLNAIQLQLPVQALLQLELHGIGKEIIQMGLQQA